MIYTDYTKIKKITFKVPDILTAEAEKKVLDLHKNMCNTKNKISDLRTQITKLEKELTTLEGQWKLLNPLMDIEYETIEKEDIQQEVNIGFNFNSEINKHIH